MHLIRSSDTMILSREGAGELAAGIARIIKAFNPELVIEGVPGKAAMGVMKKAGMLEAYQFLMDFAEEGQEQCPNPSPQPASGSTAFAPGAASR